MANKVAFELSDSFRILKERIIIQPPLFPCMVLIFLHLTEPTSWLEKKGQKYRVAVILWYRPDVELEPRWKLVAKSKECNYIQDGMTEVNSIMQGKFGDLLARGSKIPSSGDYLSHLCSVIAPTFYFYTTTHATNLTRSNNNPLHELLSTMTPMEELSYIRDLKSMILSDARALYATHGLTSRKLTLDVITSRHDGACQATLIVYPDLSENTCWSTLREGLKCTNMGAAMKMLCEGVQMEIGEVKTIQYHHQQDIMSPTSVRAVDGMAPVGTNQLLSPIMERIEAKGETLGGNGVDGDSFPVGPEERKD
ncbi:hypothetical protein K504DRAFT_507247 [Pleomassaria siparia CBS 279.74]|uniref:Uncharacterized protein n=1 Tax=Pleomassaria siparia CBS 279.74 TaxID=1314801 RepID=A0A6G1JUE8_9PLEO|nr:hypothetical protein K504DRAFT_507247 [Pleomassaria siparia CBS 279.74]